MPRIINLLLAVSIKLSKSAVLYRKIFLINSYFLMPKAFFKILDKQEHLEAQ